MNQPLSIFPLLKTCATCADRRPCDTKPGCCGVDGRDVREHAAAAACPNGRYAGVSAASLPSRGLGDTLAKLLHKMGATWCMNCGKRQAGLNKAMPYGPR